MNKPLLSVVMITYNHEKYIEQAIKGVLMQKCNFEVELIIADDCSTDKTEDIIKEIKNRNQNSPWIKYTKHKKNIGMIPNFIFALKKSKGKYTALCEGDDYWTDPLKLQKQVDFLEHNLEYVLSCHNSNIINYDDSFNRLFNKKIIPETTDTDYILNKGWYIPTASMVFISYKEQFPTWFSKGLNGDFMLQLMLTSKGGLVHYDNTVMSVYRLHADGVSNMFDKKNVANHSMLYINREFDKFSRGKYRKSIKSNIIRHSFIIINSVTINTIEFWKVNLNLLLFNRGLNREHFNKFIKRIFS